VLKADGAASLFCLPPVQGSRTALRFAGSHANQVKLGFRKQRYVKHGTLGSSEFMDCVGNFSLLYLLQAFDDDVGTVLTQGKASRCLP
jgi:hypothetical protein